MVPEVHSVVANAHTVDAVVALQWLNLLQCHGMSNDDSSSFSPPTNSNARLSMNVDRCNGIMINALDWELEIGMDHLLVTENGALALAIDSDDKSAAAKNPG